MVLNQQEEEVLSRWAEKDGVGPLRMRKAGEVSP
jgi:hypothetical protein